MPGADFTRACLADIEFKRECLTQRGFFRGHGNELVGFCNDQWFHSELVTREAFGRSAEPWEVANVIVFLASDYSSYMTGEVVSVSSQHP